MRLVIAGIIFVVAILILLMSTDDRLPCNAPGDVRYVGDRKYVCENAVPDGLRWVWKI